MTYFDPNTYDWKQLEGDDKIWASGYNDCLHDVQIALDNLVCDGGTTLPTLESIIVEVQNNFGGKLLSWLEGSRVQRVASIMDGNDIYAED